MSWRGETSGWTSFDLEHCHKQGLAPEAKDEFFPAVSSLMEQNQKSLRSAANETVLEKQLALLEKYLTSLPQDSVNFPIKQKLNVIDEKKLQGGSSSVSDHVLSINGVKDALKANEMLKELRPLAGQSLINDVFSGVNYDIDKASSSSNMMVSSEQIYDDSRVTGTKELKFNCNKSPVIRNDSLAEKGTDLVQKSCCLEGLVHKNNQDLTDEHASSRKMLLHDVSGTKMTLNSIKYLPIEPLWEKDGFYWAQRKEARKMMSSASRNSKAANDAYLRGDHLSAQFYSQKAREERLAAEQLNAKAAKEIMRIRNCKNDEWTLDLHGLHAAEAVQALLEHLQGIECQMLLKQRACVSRVNGTSDDVLSAAPEVAVSRDLEKCGSPIPLSRPKPTSLQVITGRGNHSQGEAVLPAAIRSFLNKNGYHYSEARPGVIEVQPKVRR